MNLMERGHIKANFLIDRPNLCNVKIYHTLKIDYIKKKKEIVLINITVLMQWNIICIQGSHFKSHISDFWSTISSDFHSINSNETPH